MNFQFEFDFEYNAQERKRIDRLNSPGAISPATFGVVWVMCFVPTIVCLLWMQLWSVVVTAVVLVLMASIVPAIMKFRGAAAQEFARKIQLNPVGKRETIGDSVTFVKWNAVDEIIESETDFLFSRNDRYSLLPKRAIEESDFQKLRDQIAKWRNEPEGSTEPTEMYRQLFQADDVQTWHFTISREELVTATKSTSIRPVNDKTFNFKSVEFRKGTPRWLAFLIFALILKAGLLLIVASLPPNRMDLLPMVAFLCFNPFVLLFAAGYWLRRRGIRSVPRLTPDKLSLRLFEGGWAVGNEDLVAFNKWNERSVFYAAKEFIGIRSDLSLIHVLPIHGFNGPDGQWQFLDRAIRLKKSWMRRESGEGTDTQTSIAVDNGEEQGQAVNPYRSPSVKSG